MIENDDRSRFRQALTSPAFVCASLFFAGLVVFEMLFLPRPHDFLIFAKHSANGNYLRLLIVLSISLLSLSCSLLFFYAALASPRRYRVFYFASFSLITLIEYGYYQAFQRFAVFQDAEVAFFSTNVRIVSNAALMYANYLALIPILVFGGLLIYGKPVWKKGLPALAGGSFGILAFFFVTAYFTQNTYYTNSFGAGLRTLVHFPTAWYVGAYHETPLRANYRLPRDKIVFQASEPPANNIIFIVDESVRGDYLSLNGYAKPTTPRLDELNRRNFVRNWGIAVSGTTCSGTSNSLLLTGLNELPDRDFKVYRLPTIFQYAKAMNYKTYYIDGQVSSLWNGKAADISDFGSWITVDELLGKVRAGFEIDGEIGRRIREITANSTGNFIWVNKFGVHKPYTDSYPNSETEKDNYVVGYKAEINRETLRSQYEAALEYNSRSFFSELFDAEGPRENNFYIYTSDHGQTLGENGATVSHCSNGRNEANVPLLLIGAARTLPAIDAGYRPSHANIFATLLDLMNFPESERKYKYAPSLLKTKTADSRPRFYFAGDLHGKDGAQNLPFD